MIDSIYKPLISFAADEVNSTDDDEVIFHETTYHNPITGLDKKKNVSIMY